MLIIVSLILHCMQEIRYEPRNIRETLVELKDSSELAVDLAYSAVLFDNEELAEEVIALAERASYLQYHARIALMLGAKNVTDAESLVGLFQVVDSAVAITETAADIARIPLRGLSVPPEFRAFHTAKERFVRLIVAADSPVAGEQICDLDLDVDEGVTVIAVRRGEQWVFDPNGSDKLQANDVVFARGPTEGIAEFHQSAAGVVWEQPEPERKTEGIEHALETVSELKDLSELAIGLSYSAALYDNHQFAEEVKKLEARSDELREELECWVVTESEHAGTDPAGRRGIFHLAVAAEIISDAALDIAEIVFRDVELHPVFGQVIRESREVITSVQLASESDLLGQSITGFEHEIEAGMTVLALRRNNQWLFNPAEKTELQADDTLILKGPTRGVSRVQKLAAN